MIWLVFPYFWKHPYRNISTSSTVQGETLQGCPAVSDSAVSKAFRTWRYTWRMLVLLPWPLSMINSIWWQQTVVLLLPGLFVGLELIEVSCLHRTHHLTPRDPAAGADRFKLGCGGLWWADGPTVKRQARLSQSSSRWEDADPLVEASCKNTSHFYMYCVRQSND